MKVNQLILPTDSFTLTTALSADEIKRRITENTGRKKYKSGSDPESLFKDRYTVFIKDDDFTMIQYLDGNGKKFEIQLDAKLISDQSVTKIEIHTKLETVTKTIGILYLIFSFLFFAFGMMVNLKSNSDNGLVFFLIIPAAMLVFYMVLTSTMFKARNQKLKEFLIRVLNATEERKP